MKPLLSKTTKPFLIYVLIVLMISIPVYYLVVDTIWKNELDEHNQIIVEKTAYEFNQLKLSDEQLEKSLELWNHIQPETNIERISENQIKGDSVYTNERHLPFISEDKKERYRCLKKVIYIHDRPYLFTIQTNIEESHETIAVIAMITIFFFVMIVVGLLYLNRRLSASIWKPFRDTLNRLKIFKLSSQTRIEFPASDTTEFEELNQSLYKLIEHNVSVYKTQKEFTENASHELQTPLAIIKNKLDLLLQDRDLTEKQYRIVEEMNKALTRSSRINKNLLLLAKIDNNQFDNSENIALDELLQQSIDILQEHFEQKNIAVHEKISPDIQIKGNSSLIEIMINNLIINAIRHTLPGGSIDIQLTDSLLEISNSGTEKLNTDLLFKRFSKLSADNNGSGLGLSIIQEICKFHHWTISYRFENKHHIFSVKL
ncbi:sensor histidine kinase [Chryseobacterium lactis]|uniref:histidine kinase n=1 Tax=Chryseobacterium lactis TaxID=1241981 RepID=A0A3G6RIJ0_CHRLC|nr:HAMP domain-containing sensor histidine kinase [Chryseobacterium lactis]AZA83653.1 sensor histidine kinase [Chryseobacterium lactis]AZB04038.1 sensor histidine kinase [Chryseobacterium lactis]PNW13053.1 sensor histidine kinase [Chryseobacterium lactis]